MPETLTGDVWSADNIIRDLAEQGGLNIIRIGLHKMKQPYIFDLSPENDAVCVSAIVPLLISMSHRSTSLLQFDVHWQYQHRLILTLHPYLYGQLPESKEAACRFREAVNAFSKVVGCTPSFSYRRTRPERTDQATLLYEWVYDPQEQRVRLAELANDGSVDDVRLE